MIRNNTSISALINIQHFTEDFSHDIQESKRNESHSESKRGNKLSLGTDDVILHRENYKESIKKLKGNKKINTVVGYEII
jgi:hypothetical protein